MFDWNVNTKKQKRHKKPRIKRGETMIDVLFFLFFNLLIY